MSINRIEAYLLLMTLSILLHSGATATNPSSFENISLLNTDAMNSNGCMANASLERYPLFILDCYAPWCEPCLAMNAVLSELSGELRGQAVFGMINVENNTDIKMKYNITAYPTLLFFKNGKLVKKEIGFWSKPTFVLMLKNLEPSLDFSHVNYTQPFRPAIMSGTIPVSVSGLNESGLPMVINDSNLQLTLGKYSFFVLDCFEAECDFCREMNVTVSKLSADLKGKVAFGMINLAMNNETMEKYNITAYPTLLIFKKGILIHIQIGYQSESELMEVLRRFDPSLDIRQVSLNTRNISGTLHSG